MENNFKVNLFDYMKSSDMYISDEIREKIVNFCDNNENFKNDIERYGFGFVGDFIVIHTKEQIDKFKKLGVVEHNIPYNPNDVIYEDELKAIYNYY